MIHISTDSIKIYDFTKVTDDQPNHILHMWTWFLEDFPSREHHQAVLFYLFVLFLIADVVLLQLYAPQKVTLCITMCWCVQAYHDWSLSFSQADNLLMNNLHRCERFQIRQRNCFGNTWMFKDESLNLCGVWRGLTGVINLCPNCRQMAEATAWDTKRIQQEKKKERKAHLICCEESFVSMLIPFQTDKNEWEALDGSTEYKAAVIFRGRKGG